MTVFEKRKSLGRIAIRFFKVAELLIAELQIGVDTEHDEYLIILPRLVFFQREKTGKCLGVFF